MELKPIACTIIPENPHTLKKLRQFQGRVVSRDGAKVAKGQPIPVEGDETVIEFRAMGLRMPSCGNEWILVTSPPTPCRNTFAPFAPFTSSLLF